jgi:hypothetical protein
MEVVDQDRELILRAQRRKALAAAFKSHRCLPALNLPDELPQDFSGGDAWIYFLQGDDGGPIKIGFSYRDPRSRRDAVQTGYPFGELRIVGLMRGPMQTERLLHRRFSSAAMRGEWFHPTPPVLEFVRSLPVPKGVEIGLV